MEREEVEVQLKNVDGRFCQLFTEMNYRSSILTRIYTVKKVLNFYNTSLVIIDKKNMQVMIEYEKINRIEMR